MFARYYTWLDHRTGYRKLRDALLLEHIPGGAKWRYVWGSTLAFVFTIQLVTGLLLMTAYSPSDTTAWSSVYFIQYEMDFGWLIRGLHHFGSQAMVVLLGVHMLQVVIAGAHLPPREVNWWLGLLLLGAVLALSLTGYLLPWDQKGYWATQVATNIAGNLPGLGAWLQKLIVGGPAYGHHTLTRFYALHIGILPPLVIALIIAHLTVFRRHGVTPPRHVTTDGWFWPDQAFKDMFVSMVILAVLLSVVLFGGHSQKIEGWADAEGPGFYEKWAHAGRDGRGANLDAPADPSSPYPARPEWYFLFLFQLLKYFEGDQEVIGTVVIPNGVVLLLAVLPLLGYGLMRRFGHVFGVLVVTGLLTGVGVLTYLALADDTLDPVGRWLLAEAAPRLVVLLGAVLVLSLALLWLAGPSAFGRALFGLVVVVLVVLGAGLGAVTFWGALGGAVPAHVHVLAEEHMTTEQKRAPDKVIKFHQELSQASWKAARAVNLAHEGIPVEGPANLLRRDPLTRGQGLFRENCATCHNYGEAFFKKDATASDLDGFGTAVWIRGLLREPDSPSYLGYPGSRLKRMSGWVKRARKEVQGDPEEARKLEADFDRIAQWLGTHPRGPAPKEDDPGPLAQGYRAFLERCASCHTYRGEGGGGDQGPDLTGYGDAEWLRLMVMAPDHPARYGWLNRNRMPLFRDLEGPTADVTRAEVQRVRELLLKDAPADDDEAVKKQRAAVDAATRLVHLSAVDRELLIRWLVKDYRVVFGGEPIAGPPR